MAKSQPHFVFASAQFLGITEQKSGQPEGLAIALLNRLSQRFQFTYEVQYVPWKRALQMAKQSKVDGIIGAYYSEERAGYLTYAKQPIYEDQFVLISLQSKNIQWRGELSELTGRSFALLRSALYGEWYQKTSDAIDIAVVSSLLQQFELLSVGRVDFIVNNLRTSPIQLKKLNLEGKVTFHQPALATRKGFFTATKTSKLVELLPQFDRYMQTLESDGLLQQLKTRYLKSSLILN